MSGEVNMIQTLRIFRGGQTKQIWGGASLETFSGESQLKKSPCIIPLVSQYLWCEFVFIFGAALILMH